MGDPYPYGQGQPYTLADLASGLMAAGLSGPTLSQAVAISARENAPNAQGISYTGRANTSEPNSVNALGPFQYTGSNHPGYDRSQGSQSLQYNIDYFVSHQGRQNDFSPWVIPGHGSAEFTSASSPYVQAAQQAIAQAGGGRTSSASAPVSFTPQAQIAPYQSDQARYDFLTQQQAAGGRLGSDALAFLGSFGAGNGVQPVSNPNLVAPGSQYSNDQQRYDYLQNLVSRGVAISPDAQNFLNTYQGQTASQSNASALGEVLPYLQNDIPPAPAPAVPMDPYGYQPSSGVYGNQTTTNNMTAQNAYQDVLGYQQAATQQQTGGGFTSFDPSSGAYQATVYSPSGVGTNIGGTADVGDTGNSADFVENTSAEMLGSGGTVTVGSSGRAKIAPTLAIGAPFNPETIGTFPALGKGGNLDAPEPVIFVGKYTGIPYAEAGEVPGERENITVTPIDGPDRNDNPVGPAPVPMPAQINPVGDLMNQGTGGNWGQERFYGQGGTATVGDPPPEDWPVLPPVGAIGHALSGAAGVIGNQFGQALDIASNYDPRNDWLNQEGIDLFNSPIGGPTLQSPQARMGAADWFQGQNLDPQLAGLAPIHDNRLSNLDTNVAAGSYNTPWNGTPYIELPFNRIIPNNQEGFYKNEVVPHEFFHAVQSLLTEPERRALDKIIMQYPPPTSSHDPYGSLAGGLTGYADSGNVPLEVREFLNSLAPQLKQRAQQRGSFREVPGFAEGGSATVGSPVFSQYGDPNALKLQDQTNLINSRLASIGPSQNYLNAQGNVYQSQANNFGNQQNYLGALGNVYQAQQGTFGPQQAYIGAQGNVIGAQEQQTGGERAYIGQAMGNNQQTQAEEAAYQAAERNIPDLTATAQAKSNEDSTDYLYRMAGVVPGEVDTRGGKLPEGSPVNVRAKIQSQADILKANNADSQRTRELQLQGAKLAVDLLGTNVDAARQAAARVGLTVDQAKLMVQQAQNQADIANLSVKQGDLSTSQYQNQANIAGLGVRQADLNTEQLGYQNQLSELPPQAGLTVYTNPFTGASEYMTPAQARVQQQADNIAQGAQSPSGGQSFSRSTIQSLVNKGLITDDDAFAQLTAMGYTPTQAQQLISAAKKTPRSTGSSTKAPSIQKINDDIFGGQSLDPFGLGTGSVILPNNDIKIPTAGSSGGTSGGGYTSAFQ